MTKAQNLHCWDCLPLGAEGSQARHGISNLGQSSKSACYRHFSSNNIAVNVVHKDARHRKLSLKKLISSESCKCTWSLLCSQWSHWNHKALTEKIMSFKFKISDPEPNRRMILHFASDESAVVDTGSSTHSSLEKHIKDLFTLGQSNNGIIINNRICFLFWYVKYKLSFTF